MNENSRYRRAGAIYFVLGTMDVVPATPRMLINAVLMAIILVALARASWLPFLRRRLG